MTFEGQNIINTNQQNCFQVTLGFVLLILSTFSVLVGCGGKMGKIRLEHVEAAITQSEAALDQAYLTNSKVHAPHLLSKAEQQIESAQKAKNEKQGLIALQQAYQASVNAQVAAQESTAVSREKELNTLIDQKSDELKNVRSEIRNTLVELKQIRSEMKSTNQQKDEHIKKLNRTIQKKSDKIEQSQLEIVEAQKKQSQLRDQYNEIQSEYHKAKIEISRYQSEMNQYQEQLKRAEAEVQSARQVSEEAKNRAITQGEKYSRQIENLSQSRGVLADHDLVINQKIQEARAFVQRRQIKHFKRTGRTSLNQSQMADAQRILELWNQGWWNKKLESHFGYYSPTVQIEQTIIRTNGEVHNSLNYQQMKVIIRQMAEKNWTQQTSVEKPKIAAEGNSLVANYRLNKISVHRQTQPILYDIWEREVWLEEKNSQWHIHRETWRIYKDVPKY